jgi:hypothetical protein
VPTAAAVRVQSKTHAAEPQVRADHPAFPAQWFYGLYVISLVTGLLCHRHFRELPPRKLSASVGAPEPHDFAVSFSCVRQRAAKASTSSASNVGDDRDTPVVEAGHAEDGADLGFRAIPAACGTMARRAIHA